MKHTRPTSEHFVFNNGGVLSLGAMNESGERPLEAARLPIHISRDDLKWLVRVLRGVLNEWPTP